MTEQEEIARPVPTGPAWRHDDEVRDERPPRRRDRVFLGALTVTTLAICLATLLVHRAVPQDSVGLVDLANENAWMSVLFGAGLAVLGFVVVRHGLGRAVGWSLVGFGLFWALDGLAETYVAFGVRADRLVPGTEVALWFYAQLGSFLPLGVVLPFLIYPTGRFLPGAWRVASWVTVSLFALAALVFTVSPPWPVEHPEVLPPGLDRGLTSLPYPFLNDLASTLGLLAGLSIVVPTAVVFVRHRRSRGLDRDRMRWLLWGVVVEVLLVVLTTVVGSLGIGDTAYAVTVLLPAVAVTIGLVRPRIVNVGALLAATLVDAVVTLLVITLDLAALRALAGSGTTLGDDQVVVVALTLAAVLYGPLRALIGPRTRRLVLGTRDEPYDVVSSLASNLERVEDTEAQLAAISRAVATAFGVSYVRVEVDRTRGEQLVATYGRAPEETRVLPIAYRDTEVGRLVLPVRGLRAQLSRRDEDLLADLVRQAAAAARSGRLAEELQLSREQLVLAREEERRRIRRDLHDGLGPALSGVVLRLDAASMLTETDADAARESLRVTREHVQDVVADVRRLVHDLRPPALDDLGLGGAVRQQADRMAGRLGLSVSVDAVGVDELPAAVEVAAYRIVSEALTNVVRHARAKHCEVRLAVVDRLLEVEVVDDGQGVEPAASAGVGLLSLRERAAELGGRSEVTCPEGGGTRVAAWLPMRSS